MSLSRSLRLRGSLSLLALAITGQVQAQQGPAPTASEWGGIGLLQTPTARMAEDGELAFTASHNSPYSRYNLTLQPFPWLEGSFRYINVANRRYGPESLSGDQNYKDKSIDFKLRLWRESRYLPEVALGFRDFGGTGLFSSEYLVANKRFGPIDASLGLATGYIGNRGDFSNPLGWIDKDFKNRQDNSRWGDIDGKALFRGRVGVFGGLSYQTPWRPLQVKLEYDGNDYKHEPKDNNLRQRTPLNLGLVYSPNRNVQITAAWERGDAAMFAISLRSNPGHATTPPKPLDPPPVPLQSRAPSTAVAATTATASTGPTDAAPAANHRAAIDWQSTGEQLRNNAGLRVNTIEDHGREWVVAGQQMQYFHSSQGLGRTARILDGIAPPEVEWFTVRSERLGMPTVEASVNRKAFADYLDHRIDLETLRRSVVLAPPSPGHSGKTLFAPPFKRFGGGFNFGYKQNLGGPDGFILYQINANYSGSYFFTRNLWLTGTASANLVNNYDKFKYTAPSNLPRVRTYLREYMVTSDVTLPNLQLTTAGKLGRDLYGMAYAGYLEWMYAGVGGELLYRPWGERWAIGVNANWVKQREFDQHFGLRDYSIGTGHATLYYAFGRERRTQAVLSVGRYLAGDKGATLNLSRVFRNGVVMGAYVTKTNVSSEEFGEGSFDKGIYFSIPFDTVLPRSVRAIGTFLWQPLYRDGGAMLGRKYGLYSITGERNEWFFQENLDKIDK